jgi:hypothetical protein
VQTLTKANKKLTLKKLLAQDHTEYFHEVNNKLTAKKEQGMKTLFERGYEVEVNKIRSALEKKVEETADKVNQRISKAEEPEGEY